MDALQVQNFTNGLLGSVRSTLIDNEPWFIGSDIATCLGYSNPWDALSKHVEECDKANLAIRDVNSIQSRNMVIINESGLYSLIFGSKLPAAKEFKHWVTSEVLPTMRKIGFDRSLQELQNQLQLYQQSALESGVDRAEVAEMRVQMIEKLRSLPTGTPLTEETKQFIIQYDPNWEANYNV